MVGLPRFFFFFFGMKISRCLGFERATSSRQGFKRGRLGSWSSAKISDLAGALAGAATHHASRMRKLPLANQVPGTIPPLRVHFKNFTSLCSTHYLRCWLGVKLPRQYLPSWRMLMG